MSDTKYLTSNSTGFKSQVPSMLYLTEEFKCKAEHFYPDAIAFAIMLGDHGVEISTTVPPRKLVEILRDTANALEHSLDEIPEDKLEDVSEMTLAFSSKHQQ